MIIDLISYQIVMRRLGVSASTGRSAQLSPRDKSVLREAHEDAKNIVFVLGAGASKEAGYPVVGDILSTSFIDSVYAEMPTYEGEAETNVFQEELKKRCNEIKERGGDFEQIFSHAVEEDRHDDVKYLKSYLSHIFCMCRELTTNHMERFESYLKLAELTRQILVQPGHRVGLMTFNYDLAFDVALQMVGSVFDLNLSNYGFMEAVHYPLQRIVAGVPSVQPPFVGGYVPYLKMHGSFNWGYCTACDKYNLFHTETFSFFEFTDLDREFADFSFPKKCWLCRGVIAEPAIIPPIQDKDAARFPSQWQTAREILSAADLVVFVGYSLPPYDVSARSLLRASRTDSGRVSKTLVIDVDTTPEKKERFEEAMGECLFIECSLGALLDQYFDPYS